MPAHMCTAARELCPRDTAGSCPRRSPCSCQCCPRCTAAASRPTDILHRSACACAPLGCAVFDRPTEFLCCKACFDNRVMRHGISLKRTQPRQEPPMSMEDQRSDIGHCPQTALWDETVKRNVRHGKRDRRRRVAEERAHARESARESICNQSYFSLTCADKSEQPTGPRTNNNTAAAHAAIVLVVHQCGARESCLWSPPASAHFALAF